MEHIAGVVASMFNHHVTIVLEDGRGFRVPSHDLVEERCALMLRKEAKIEYVFPGTLAYAGQPVWVPHEVADRLPQSI